MPNLGGPLPARKNQVDRWRIMTCGCHPKLTRQTTIPLTTATSECKLKQQQCIVSTFSFIYYLEAYAIPPTESPTIFIYRHQDLNPTGAKREGYMRGSVLTTKNGFTKSTALHRYGNDPDPTHMVRSMNSYQAR